MKRLLAVIAGGLGLRAVLRRGRHAPAEGASAADDLKAKLAETRAGDEPPVVEDADLDARRADVHARARQAIDDLN